MRSVWFGGVNNALSNSVANFGALTGGFFTAWSPTESGRQIPISEAVTIKSFTVYSDVAIATGSYTFAIDDNGVATAASLVLSASATTATFTGSVAIAQDHLISLRSTPATTPTATTNLYWVIEYETTTDNFVWLGTQNTNLSASATAFMSPIGDMGFALATTEVQRSLLVPDAGTITRLSVATPPGTPSPGTYAFSIRKNATTDLLTATIATAATAAQATGSAAVVAGDSLVIKVVPATTPTVRQGAWSVSITPTSHRGTWWGWGGDNNGTGLASSIVTDWDQLTGTSIRATPENSRFLKAGAYRIRNLYVSLATAPGGVTTRTFTIRDNSAATALAVTLTGAAVTGNNITSVATLSGGGNPIDVESAAVGPPAASASYALGWVFEIAQPGDVPAVPFRVSRRAGRLVLFGPSVRGSSFEKPRKGLAPGQFVTPMAPTFQSTRRLFTLARRGRIAYFAPVGASLEQVPVPDRIVPTNRRRNFALARRGRIIPPRMVGFAPGQLDPPFPIKSRSARTFALARRGQFYKIPIVGRAPGQNDPPFPIKSRSARSFPLARRGQFYWRGRAAPTPHAPFISRRVQRIYTARRGQFVQFAPPPVAAVVVTTIPTVKVSRRITGLPVRRGQFFWRGRAAPTPHAGFISRRVQRIYTARRGLFFKIPMVGFAPGQLDTAIRTKSRSARSFALARHGIFFQLPFPVVVPPGTQAKPPDWIVPANRRRVFPLARRGRIAYFPLVGLSPVITTTIPSFKASRRLTAARFTRRGQFYWRGHAAPTPHVGIVTRRVQRIAPARRGAFFLRVHGVGGVPHAPFISRRVQRIAPARRGAFFSFTITPTQLPLVPAFRATRRLTGARFVRHGVFLSVPPVVDRSVVTFRSSRRPLAARVLPRHSFGRIHDPAPHVPRRYTSPARRITNLRLRHGSFQATPQARLSVNGAFFPFFG